MRKISLILLGATAGVAMTLLVVQPRSIMIGASAKAAVADTYRQLNLFGDVFERVRADYVEKPDDSKLIESAINGMLAGLDPHSSYMDAKSFRDMQVQTRGEFGGLGIEVTMEEGLIKVVAPIDETPASKAGVMANDIITKLDDEQVQGLTLNQAVEKMRGPTNTKIKLTIMRKGADKPLELTLTRDVIRVRAVRSNVEGDDVGFIRMTQFNEQTTEGLKKAIADITAKVSNDKLKGYVLDLRNNPGGLLDQAISVSDAFLEKGEIVSTRGRNAEETQRFNARPGDLTNHKPVIVLINGGSASAALGNPSPARCRTTSARHGHRHAFVPASGSGCRPSSRSAPAMARCGSPRRATSRLPAARSRPRASPRTSKCSRTYPTTSRPRPTPAPRARPRCAAT